MAGKAAQYPRLDGLQTPVCRLVGGNPAVAQTTDKDGKLKEKPSYYFAIALPKAAPEFKDLWERIYAHTWGIYRNMPGMAAVVEQGLGSQIFSWKIEDGDSPAQREREGRAGCWILHFSQGVPIRCAKWENGQNVQVDAAAIPRGSFVDVGFSTTINGKTDKQAGIYLNPQCLRILWGGPFIADGPSIDQVMSRAPVGAAPVGAVALPAGATPLAAPASAPPALPASAPAPAPAPVPAPAPAPAPAAAPVAETDEAWNIRHTGTHAAGYRYNPASNAWDAAAPAPAPVVPTPAPAPAPSTHAASAPPPPPVAASPTESDEAWNIRHTGTHAAGYRYVPETNSWGPGNVAAVSVAPASVTAPPAPLTPPPPPGTVVPSNVAPHPAFPHGGAR